MCGALKTFKFVSRMGHEAIGFYVVTVAPRSVSPFAKGQIQFRSSLLYSALGRGNLRAGPITRTGLYESTKTGFTFNAAREFRLTAWSGRGKAQ